MNSGYPDLNKLHPLTEYARGRLQEIARAPVPTLEINAGVLDRFQRGRLIELVELKSPYKSHHGRPIPHAKITDAGRAELGLPVPEKKGGGRAKKKR